MQCVTDWWTTIVSDLIWRDLVITARRVRHNAVLFSEIQYVSNRQWQKITHTPPALRLYNLPFKIKPTVTVEVRHNSD